MMTGTMEETPQQLLRVGGGTGVHDLAKSIDRRVGAGARTIRLRAIGAGAVNQAMKGAAEANARLALRGLTSVIIPSFETVPGDSAHRPVVSAMVFTIIIKELSDAAVI